MAGTESLTPNWEHCYRLRPKFRNIGIAAIAFGAVMGVWSTLVAWFNVDGSFAEPVLAAVVFAGFWSGLVILGIALVLLFYRYRLFVSGSMILQLGVIRRQQAELSRVEQLTWHRFPQGGSARLSGAFGVLKIDFGNIKPTQREHLIALLRQAIDESKQRQWQEFCDQLADTPEKRERVRRTVIRFGVLLIALGLAFLSTWLAGFGAKLLGAAIMNSVFGALMLWRGCRAAQPNFTHFDNVPALTSEERRQQP